MPLDTKLTRMRAKLSLAVDLEPRADGKRTTLAEAERLVIEYLLGNPQLLRDNIRVSFRHTEEKDGER